MIICARSNPIQKRFSFNRFVLFQLLDYTFSFENISTMVIRELLAHFAS